MNTWISYSSALVFRVQILKKAFVNEILSPEQWYRVQFSNQFNCLELPWEWAQYIIGGVCEKRQTKIEMTRWNFWPISHLSRNFDRFRLIHYKQNKPQFTSKINQINVPMLLQRSRDQEISQLKLRYKVAKREKQNHRIVSLKQNRLPVDRHAINFRNKKKNYWQ